jgi:hypothetical protein
LMIAYFAIVCDLEARLFGVAENGCNGFRCCRRHDGVLFRRVMRRGEDSGYSIHGWGSIEDGIREGCNCCSDLAFS